MDMSYDDCFDGCDYDDSYDPADDIYAGTAVCDDGSDQDYEDRMEGEDVEGELGVVDTGAMPGEGEDDLDANTEPMISRPWEDD